MSCSSTLITDCECTNLTTNDDHGSTWDDAGCCLSFCSVQMIMTIIQIYHDLYVSQHSVRSTHGPPNTMMPKTSRTRSGCCSKPTASCTCNSISLNSSMSSRIFESSTEA
ncbi:hypothetical protein MPTK1_8g06800 [Marchantia polymorpha subsp. ruderalis]|uniref:Uncharacterized protein n=1 Tax=Marchantia polymorpha TaxID=3197 RepID=A0A2R6XIE9_MARPO|nr:hypothetical protein MARPO_0013s0112 [Marchantia polymorpha]BBN18958.1 hypothetical protein Mp_8g06800 [Marchantia polymorpha subsp. ruderalis]|eukprot:PTQ45888.1 hypothetical protein MARPO_0013s0112 [Marchantia polymorpha]